MSHNNKHITNIDDRKFDDFFTKVEIPYAKSKGEIWDNLVTKIDEGDKNIKVDIQKSFSINHRFIVGIAATLIVLLGSLIVLRYYSTTISCPSGEHISATLPDGSTVTINSNSTLTYYPLWWQFGRNVSLTGEAFFEVEKGNKFNVISTMGKTVVLGTSFNIFSRGIEYKVTCVTGKVKVISKSNQEVILSPNYLAELNNNGEFVVRKTQNIKSVTSWIDDMFVFTSAPLTIVIDEIEHHFNVNITSEIPLNYSYTGFFSKQKSVEEVLNLLCKPFDLTYKKTSERSFDISKSKR